MLSRLAPMILAAMLPVLAACDNGADGTGDGAGAAANQPPDYAEAVRIGNGRKWTQDTPMPDGFEVSNGFGFVIQRGSHRTLDVDEDNKVVGGEAAFTKAEIAGNRVVDRKLQIMRFLAGDDVAVVFVDVSQDKPQTLLSRVARSVDLKNPALLVDNNGTVYQAIGYVYNDQNLYRIRYTPGKPIRSLAELDKAKVMLSTARPDQQLRLIFRISLGTEIREFRLGHKVICTLDPGIPVKDRQK